MARLSKSGRAGNQRPTFESPVPYAYSEGDYVVELFRTYKVRMYLAQEYEMHVLLARNDDGSFAASTVCISKPRQNGKSFGVRFYSIYEAAIEGKKVLYTAHRGKTMRKMFKFMKAFVLAFEDFRKILDGGESGVYSAAGTEGIYFDNGGCIEFATRTAGGSRGESYDIIVIDEAQELTDDELEALEPTTFASDAGDPQMIFIGTPPGPKCPGTVFRNMHDNAHDGKATSIWWLEWAVMDIGDPFDVDRWYETNPALGIRIREKSLRGAAEKMSPDGFARECLGWWNPVRTDVEPPALSQKAWKRCVIKRSPDPSAEGAKLCYGVKFSFDGSLVALAAAVKPRLGRPHVEVVFVRPCERGVSFVAGWLARRAMAASEALIDGDSQSSALEEKLIERGAPKRSYRIAKTADVVAGCSTLAAAVDACEVTHCAQPGLDESARCPKRRINKGGSWAFGATEELDPIAIEACALAYRSVMTSKRRPGRKQRLL